MLKYTGFEIIPGLRSAKFSLAVGYTIEDEESVYSMGYVGNVHVNTETLDLEQIEKKIFDSVSAGQTPDPFLVQARDELKKPNPFAGYMQPVSSFP